MLFHWIILIGLIFNLLIYWHCRKQTLLWLRSSLLCPEMKQDMPGKIEELVFRYCETARTCLIWMFEFLNLIGKQLFCRFLNKGLSDFNLALDLGFLTKARKYTFFKPKFIFYATYLSEKIGYWRYITIYRHLKQNPEFQCYPIFKYFENWCQDENRHGDFFSALMKAQPQFLNDWQAKLWSRFFCLSVSKLNSLFHFSNSKCVLHIGLTIRGLILQVYVTMYLNDCQRTDFYEGIGLNTKEFDMHVIIEVKELETRRLILLSCVLCPFFLKMLRFGSDKPDNGKNIPGRAGCWESWVQEETW